MVLIAPSATRVQRRELGSLCSCWYDDRLNSRRSPRDSDSYLYLSWSMQGKPPQEIPNQRAAALVGASCERGATVAAGHVYVGYALVQRVRLISAVEYFQSRRTYEAASAGNPKPAHAS